MRLALSFISLAPASGDEIVRSLARASIQGAIFIAAVWVLCRCVPRLPAALRCALWWLACSKLLISLASGLGWVPSVALPWLGTARAMPAGTARPAGPATPAERVAAWIVAPGPGAAPSSAIRAVAAPLSGADTARSNASLVARLPRAGAAVWLAGLLLQLGLAGHGLRRARAIVRRSQAVTAPGVAALCAEICRRLGVRRRVAVRSSREVGSPQTIGAWRPVVLLPAHRLDGLSREDLTMALCHELVHVRRRDLAWGWVPATARWLFFFHPLAALAAREYAVAREAACDAEVLRLLGVAPASYGRLLVRLGVTRRGSWLARPRPHAPGSSGAAGRPGPLPEIAALGAAPSFADLKRRLQMLQQASTPTSPRGARAAALRIALALLALAVAAGLMPLRMAAQRNGQAKQASPAARAVEQPAPAVRYAAQPAPAANPAEPPAPAARRHSSWKSDGGGARFVLLTGGSSTMSGDSDDVEHARELQRRHPGDLLWFERGGRSYVVRDPATLAAARELFRPQQELGARQAELGARQAELGARQADLGAQQGALGAQQGQLGAQQARLGVKQARLAVDEAARDSGDPKEGGDTGDLERQRRETDGKMRELDKQMNELGRQQDALGRQQEDLGRQQAKLGAEQGKLGREQERLGREAAKRLQALLDKALAAGLAQEDKD
jgi:bla regulator protein blaR1